MKNSEIKALSVEELSQKLGSEKESYRRLKFSHAVSPIENPMKIKSSRRFIARLETELRVKQSAK